MSLFVQISVEINDSIFQFLLLLFVLLSWYFSFN